LKEELDELNNCISPKKPDEDDLVKISLNLDTSG